MHESPAYVALLAAASRLMEKDWKQPKHPIRGDGEVNYDILVQRNSVQPLERMKRNEAIKVLKEAINFFYNL